MDSERPLGQCTHGNVIGQCERCVPRQVHPIGPLPDQLRQLADALGEMQAKAVEELRELAIQVEERYLREHGDDQ